MSPTLSSAQWDVLEKLKAEPAPIRFGEVRRRSIKALENFGLVSWTYEVQPDAMRGRHRLWMVTQLTDKGRKFIGAKP